MKDQPFLTSEEIAMLTGVDQVAAQKKMLQKCKIHFVENRNGLVVARAWLDNAPFYNRDRVIHEAANSNLPSIGKLGG